MTLDLATLLAAITLATTSLAIPVLFVALRSRVHQGLALWGVGLVVNALSYPVFGWRALGWTQTSIVLTNLLTGMTLVLHTLALASYQQGRGRQLSAWVVWMPLALNMLVVVVFLRDDHWRNILIAATQSVMAVLLLREAWGPRLHERRLTGRWILVGGATLLLLALLCRTVFMVLASDWDAKYNVPSQVQAITYFAIMAVLLINSMGFVLMQMERAIELQRSLATHDGLTGVYNRSALNDLLPMLGAQARRKQEPLAFLMLDIDHFKFVNDDHGHLAGDEVLREVARRIRLRLRQSDILARFGGEEFLAILPSTDGSGGMRLAEEIRQAIGSRPIPVPGASVSVTISIGVHAGVPDLAVNVLEGMIDLSDKALYAAKTHGRNRVMLA